MVREAGAPEQMDPRERPDVGWKPALVIQQPQVVARNLPEQMAAQLFFHPITQLVT